LCEPPPDLSKLVHARWLPRRRPGEDGRGDGGVRREPVRRGKATLRPCTATLRACPRPGDRQIHPLGERAQGPYEPAQGLYERAPVLYESAAAIFRLPQDRSALAKALSKEPPVRKELAGVACEDAFDRISAVEVLSKTRARRRELAPSHEPLSRVPCTRVEVIGCFDGDRRPSVVDLYIGSSRTGALAPLRGD
jgi:hypothetical protein